MKDRANVPITVELMNNEGGRPDRFEFRCQEFAEELIYGHLRRTQLVKHYDGKTLAIDITRKVSTNEEDLYDKHYIPPQWKNK